MLDTPVAVSLEFLCANARQLGARIVTVQGIMGQGKHGAYPFSTASFASRLKSAPTPYGVGAGLGRDVHDAIDGLQAVYLPIRRAPDAA